MANWARETQTLVEILSLTCPPQTPPLSGGHSGILSRKELASVQSQCLVTLTGLGVSLPPGTLTPLTGPGPLGALEGDQSVYL